MIRRQTPGYSRRVNPVLVLFALGLWLCCAQAPAQNQLDLTILYTNDLHGHLFPFDYDQFGTPERDVGGAARRATLIRTIRKQAGHPCLVLDAGDLFTRGPLSDLLGAPDFAMLNAVPYDALTLGNNEFKGAAGSAGMRALEDRLREARFAVLSANVRDKKTGAGLVPAYEVFQLGDLKVGVLGLTTTQTEGDPQAESLQFDDPIETARRIVPELETKCDFIVALTHLGYPIDLALAAAVPGIDVIIGGHSHTWVFQPTPVGSTIVCQDGEWGSTLGRLDLTLRRIGAHRWTAASFTGRLITIDRSIVPAADVETLLWRWAAPYTRVVGRLSAAVTKAGAAEWIARAMRDAARTDIAIEPVDAVENGLKAGVVTQLDVRMMFPYVNRIVTVKVSGKQLKMLLSEKRWGMAGVTSRGGKLFARGKPISPELTYTVALEDYYASYSRALSSISTKPLSITTREAILRYLASSDGCGPRKARLTSAEVDSAYIGVRSIVGRSIRRAISHGWYTGCRIKKPTGCAVSG